MTDNQAQRRKIGVRERLRPGNLLQEFRSSRQDCSLTLVYLPDHALRTAFAECATGTGDQWREHQQKFSVSSTCSGSVQRNRSVSLNRKGSRICAPLLKRFEWVRTTACNSPEALATIGNQRRIAGIQVGPEAEHRAGTQVLKRRLSRKTRRRLQSSRSLSGSRDLNPLKRFSVTTAAAAQ